MYRVANRLHHRRSPRAGERANAAAVAGCRFSERILCARRDISSRVSDEVIDRLSESFVTTKPSGFGGPVDLSRDRRPTPGRDPARRPLRGRWWERT